MLACGGLPLAGAPESLTAADRVGDEDPLWVFDPAFASLCVYAAGGRSIRLVGARMIRVDLGLERLREQE